MNSPPPIPEDGSRSLSQPSSPKRDSGLASSAASSVRPASSAVHLEDLEPGGVAPTPAPPSRQATAVASASTVAPSAQFKPLSARSVPVALDQAADAAETGGGIRATSSYRHFADDDFTPIVVTVAKDLPGQTGAKSDGEDEEVWTPRTDIPTYIHMYR